MTMAEFFRSPIVGFLLRAVDTFPVDRDRADRKTIRTAIERLKEGRVIGLFPEGGIRDGARSVLEGAPLRRGAPRLAHIAGVPILPCVIVGSDRFYSTTRWLPFSGGRTPVWIAFGNPISDFPDCKKLQARDGIESELASAFKNLYAELRERFQLTADALPQPPQDRMVGRIDAPRRPDAAGRRPWENTSVFHAEAKGKRFHRLAASGIDGFLCASINFLHTRHRLNERSRDEMERYVEGCERFTADQYYASAHDHDLAEALGNGHATITWRSPIETEFPANNIARVDVFRSERGRRAPTLFILHALMSASRVGYRRCAQGFNRL